ncbi:MAG TPA: leucyl aminopeptidase [Candidatus Dormibacteraeota bacterium]|nr:leucyl aminopeptidase [Candidatus Dormibacteraeota bacterium]
MKFARAASFETVQADILILPVVQGDGLDGGFDRLDQQVTGALRRAADRGFSGKFASTVVLDTLGAIPAQRLMLLGLGAREDIDRTRLNNALEMGVRQAGSPLPGRLAVAWNEALGPGVSPGAMACATVEGSVLAQFTEATHKSGAKPRSSGIDRLTLCAFPDVPDSALRRSLVLAEETLAARREVNQPANELFPQAYAEEARRRGLAAGLDVEILGERDLERLKYGAILAVGQGSARPPRMVVLRHGATAGEARKRRKPARPMLAFVGKGVTFDSGGISIKPSADMGAMKGDMGGAAAVLGAMCAIGRLKLPVDVVGILCIAENMLSSKAMRPGDVVRSGSGTTIEVISTDAEGRMVMADGMYHAVQMGATHILDIATLTGGQRIALGQVAAHVQGSDAEFTARLEGAAKAAGERIWEMPNFPEYRSILDSPIADLMNSTVRDGMAITSGLFMREFAAGLPWIHVDMAAPSWNRVSAIKEMPKGPTGFGVRMLVNLAERFANPDKFSRK